ncbi:MAG: hypothetical protein JKY44_01775 [Flavobacteriaceae bacterium]|nr:hypothetical protein [Flavobacteriaceae bacterium]
MKEKHQITDKYIAELYKFTREHFVEHYDVQTELVDHLANDIEQIWVAQPQLSFNEAKIISFKKFGIFGFMDVVEQKQKVMNKRYWKILWRFVKEWFSVPKIILTASVFTVFILLFQLRVSSIIVLIAIVTLLTFEFINEMIIKYKLRIIKKRKQKLFLLEEMIHNTKSGLLLVSVFNIFNFMNVFKIDFSSLSIYWVGLSSFVVTLFLVIYYVVTFVMPSKAEELLAEVYPEYKFL